MVLSRLRQAVDNSSSSVIFARADHSGAVRGAVACHGFPPASCRRCSRRVLLKNPLLHSAAIERRQVGALQS